MQLSERAEDKAGRGAPVDEEVAAALSKNKTLEALEPEVDASFAATEQHLKDHHLPPEILERHRAAVQELKAKQQELKRLLQDLEDADKAKDETGRRAKVQALADFLKQHQHKKPHTPVDPHKLPFRTPAAKVRPPKESAEEFQATLFKPAPVRLAGPVPSALPPAGLSPTPTPEDLAETEDVQLTQAIRDLAASLDKSPVKIFNWVRNNIEFLPTYGAIQGSDLTLQTQRGNAFDTASLLIALLRASNIPARYVCGTIQVPIDQAMNWVGGVTKPEAVLDLLAQGGIPSIGLVSGGSFKAVKLEHMWVEAWVDYVPSRGAVNRVGDTWVPLDAAFKQYAVIPSLIPADFTADIQGVAASYTQSATRSPDGAWSTGFDASLLTGPIAAVQAKTAVLLEAHPDKIALEEIIGGRSIAASESSILAGTLPYRVVASGVRFSALPANLRIAAEVELYTVGAGGEGALLLSKPISLPALGYASLNLTHVPSTAQDAAVWDSYTNAGAQSFPAYLVNVKSRLTLDGVILAESADVGAGQDLMLKVSFNGAGQSQTATFLIVAGDEMEIGINGAGQSPLQGLALKDRTDLGTAAGNLYATAKVYWTQQDFQQTLLARLHGVAAIRLPSVGIFAAPMSVSYWFGIPRLASYHSHQVDIKLAHVAVVALDGNSQAVATFVMHSGIIGSATEGAVIEEVFSKPLGHGANTMRLLQLANEQHMPIYHLKPSNIAANRAVLQHAPEVMTDIENALSAGLEVIIPQSRQTHGAWTGSGYIMVDPVTGSADYRVSGGLSGNFDDEACQRSTQPIRVIVPDIALIWWILLGWMVDDDFNFNGTGIAAALAQVVMVTALVGIVAAAAPAVSAAVVAGGTEVATLARATFTAILVALSATAADEDGVEDCSCKWEPVKRRGGKSIYTEIHNLCANKFTDFRNCPGTPPASGQ